MTDETQPAAAPAAPQNPQMAVLAQYLQDLSFESPSPLTNLQMEERPAIQVDVDVQARKLNDEQYEVKLIVNVEAKKKDSEEVAFVVESVYCGIFLIRNVPENHMEGFLIVECARLLFPFARSIIANATRDGSFPPLMLDPIDFLGLFQKKQQERAAAQAQVEQAQAEAEGQPVN